MSETRTVPLDSLTLEPRAWPRAGLDAARVAALGEAIEGARERNPASFTAPWPPLIGVSDGAGSVILADGHHRTEALRRADITDATVEVCGAPAGRLAVDVAYELALKHTTESALPLNQRERRIAILRLAAEHPEYSHRTIGRLVGADHSTVTTVVAKLTDETAVDREPSRHPVTVFASRLVSVAQRIGRLDEDYDETEWLTMLRRELKDAGGPECLEPLAGLLDELLDEPQSSSRPTNGTLLGWMLGTPQ